MAREQSETEDTSAELTISPETVFYIIVKAREYDEDVPPSGLEGGSNPSDDNEVASWSQARATPRRRNWRAPSRGSMSMSSSI